MKPLAAQALGETERQTKIEQPIEEPFDRKEPHVILRATKILD